MRCLSETQVESVPPSPRDVPMKSLFVSAATRPRWRIGLNACPEVVFTMCGNHLGPVAVVWTVATGAMTPFVCCKVPAGELVPAINRGTTKRPRAQRSTTGPRFVLFSRLSLLHSFVVVAYFARMESRGRGRQPFVLLLLHFDSAWLGCPRHPSLAIISAPFAERPLSFPLVFLRL